MVFTGRARGRGFGAKGGGIHATTRKSSSSSFDRSHYRDHDRSLSPPRQVDIELLFINVKSKFGVISLISLNEGKGHGHSHGGDSHGHSHNTAKASQAQIMQGVFLHILADTLGSVGVIISSLLIYYFGWMIADPLCSMFIAVLVTISVLPLLRDSVGILMQRTPRELDHVLPGCYQRVSQLEGVYSVQEPHFWTLCSEVYIGTIKLEVAMNADTRYILSQTHNIFTQAGVRQLYVQIDTAPM
eukprot:XP_019930473.1 PREDICTED: zinc transporter 7-like [Crassostrea gigas]